MERQKHQRMCGISESAEESNVGFRQFLACAIEALIHMVAPSNHISGQMIDLRQNPLVEPLRIASRRLVRELGFMNTTLAGTDYPPSAVHALIEIGQQGALAARDLCGLLNLDKSSVSRMLRRLVEGGEVEVAQDGRDARSKLLSLTRQGQKKLSAINALASSQANAALSLLSAGEQQRAVDGMTAYAGALKACRTGEPVAGQGGVDIEFGYRPGIIGRTAEMHGRYYARASGFGSFFEGKVAQGLAEFAGRLDNPRNGLWAAVSQGAIIGTVAIDGEDMGQDVAHLRWFIVDDGVRGLGIGRRLLAVAMDFCRRQGFASVQLWTFQGLDAARNLYESCGFSLAEEFPGRQWGKEVIEQRFIRQLPGAA